MKIVFLVTRMDECGGVQIHIRDLATLLVAQGHDVHVLAGQVGNMADWLIELGIPVHEVPSMMRSINPFYDLWAILEVVTLLRRLRPDILSCHSSKAGIVGRIAGRLTRTPTLFTVHGWAFTEGVPMLKRIAYAVIEKLAGFISDHIVTVSEHDRALGLKTRILPENRITAIHNGMPDLPRRDRSTPEVTTDGKEAPIRLIMIARFAPQKDHETLLKALSELKDLRWTLDLIGNGDDSEMRDLADSLGIAKRIAFRGERLDAAEMLDRADIFLLISRWEGFPRSILEAMRASLPVIASRVGGVAESVEDGKTGIVVPPGDVAALTAALRQLIPNRDLQRQMGEAGRDRFEAHFRLVDMARKTIDVYGQVIDWSQNRKKKKKPGTTVDKPSRRSASS